MSIADKITELKKSLPAEVQLIAVSKTYPPETIMEAYRAGQRVFGENRPQELLAKYEQLPHDIEWHMIGGLQTNKVKYIAPFVKMIHSVESEKLLLTIQKEALKNKRTIDVLFEVHIAREEAKHGWKAQELIEYLKTGRYKELNAIRFRGLMGVATNTEDTDLIRKEFSGLHDLFKTLREEFFDADFDTLSMGMTSDYPIAVECGATTVRIGSYIFGARNYAK
ncbi:MAG TPA: YggS family pyridoxal phosphate-dependent enzyme [Candidatus Alistipes merdigallinarum]|nr:YggS family pyridoxal phosphate-dependent enzyme [Candidatus Alistipes merdigallinarum]